MEVKDKLLYGFPAPFLFQEYTENELTKSKRKQLALHYLVDNSPRLFFKRQKKKRLISRERRQSMIGVSLGSNEQRLELSKMLVANDIIEEEPDNDEDESDDDGSFDDIDLSLNFNKSSGKDDF